VSAEHAIKLDADEPNGWWFSALSHQALGNLHEALEALVIVNNLSPDFANGWARYGAVLQALYADEDDQYEMLLFSAREAFEKAINIDDSHSSALTALSKIYSENDSDDPDEIDKEIYVLSRLDELEKWLTDNQLNRLGILHYKNKNFFDAIRYWERNIQRTTDPASLFNLGLVYNHTEVSQDADAIDFWRLTVQRYPKYDRAVTQINKLLPRMLTLSQEAMSTGKTVLDAAQWYQHYLNPFELLGFQEEIDAPGDIDIKEIQRLRKRLIQEIELENGVVPWMKDLQIDRSKAIRICEDLHNDRKSEFHLHVFNNKPLLGFLGRGEHRHFTVDDDWSPLDTLEYLGQSKNGFREWLTEPFTKQFKIVIEKAIDEENLAVLEVLLDGRRWVAKPNTEQFFEGARKKIDQRLEKLEEENEKAEVYKPSVDDVSRLLNEGSLLEMLNLFPTFFWKQQDRAVEFVRGLAVTSYNKHDDSSLCKGILELSERFLFKSKKHNEIVKKDFKAIEDIISEEKKHEVNLTSGKDRWEILKDGVRQGKNYIPTDSIHSVRWGEMISGYEASPTHEYLFVFKSDGGDEVKFQWEVTSDLKKHEQYNKSFIDAILHYVMQGVIDKQVVKLEGDQIIQIGSCATSRKGIEFKTKGYFFSKNHFVPWSQVEFDIENGSLVVIDSREPKKRISLSLREVDNAMTLQFLKREMK